MVKPCIRWAGSKRQLLPVLAKHWNDNYARYVEPFAGSACLFFHLSPKAALLGDINDELIHTYRQVRTRVHQVSFCLEHMRESKKEYLRLREVNPLQLSAHERAARFLYLNRFCFNGLYRTNENGKFNVPYSGRKTGDLPSREELQACSQQLRKADLVGGDFSQVLKRVRFGDFVYMDPPFSVRSHRVFNEYDRSIFDPDDLERLRNWMERLANKRISFLVSYADSAEARMLRKNFRAEFVGVRRYIAGFTGHRVKEREMLISFTPTN